MNTKIKKGDTVKVISGKEKGKTGKVLRVNRDTGRVIVQGLNIVKKAKKARSQQDKGGIIDIEAALHLSNVMLVTKKGEVTRAGYKFEGDQKVRIAKKTEEEL